MNEPSVTWIDKAIKDKVENYKKTLLYATKTNIWHKGTMLRNYDSAIDLFMGYLMARLEIHAIDRDYMNNSVKDFKEECRMVIDNTALDLLDDREDPPF